MKGSVAQQPTQSTRFCFTVNNPELVADGYVPEAGPWNAPWRSWAGVSYVIWSLERSETGTVHVQGYLETASRTRFTSLKKVLSPNFLSVFTEKFLAQWS